MPVLECWYLCMQEVTSEREEELKQKVEDLKANRVRKLKARQKYEQYVEQQKRCKQSAGTDYAKWDLFTPEDEEDDMFNACTPNNPQFKAMEKDIDERHAR